MIRRKLEVCVETLADLYVALAGGADRIELCSALALGGLTPSAGLVAQAVDAVRQQGMSIRAMVRPRDGDFAYDVGDLATAQAEGLALIGQGVDGLVFGAARAGQLDYAALSDWTAAMRTVRPDIGLTLHRAIDLVDDPVAAVDQAVHLGFDHILTSGGATRAIDALPMIAAMQARAAGRIVIMPGAGVRAANVGAIIAATGVSTVHASASEDKEAVDVHALALGFARGNQRRTSLAQVRAIREAIDQ
ncbi:copper homeostasis protein CutC [Sphingobium terrigena]|uniref:PF03932 family protein CutC n=1 Tax=Sphingobium terrigena TaxID=2304063 RepID=A0A418YVF1_9SPHN|nr:copper homeostasis protein CutC [Sphingobium terrigena]RJG56212.1 copper homeostasis protein CutC [Sphingobium terrigena]